MKNFGLVYLIFAALMTIIDFVFIIRWTIRLEYLIPWNAWILFVPTVVCGGAYFVSRKSPGLSIHLALAPMCLAICGFGVSTTLFSDGWIMALAPVKDVRQYEDILDTRWNNLSELVNQFPRPIPPDARDLHFYFLQHFLQGAHIIQLRYSASERTIAELYDRFSEQKTKSFFGKDSNTHMNRPEGMPTTFFWTSGSENLEFPDDFEIMIFDPVLKEEDRPPGHYWNHGESHGVAISKKRNEIVYWAESW